MTHELSTSTFEAGKEVPDAYGADCAHCGYSLVGLTRNRCPECGNDFDPNELAVARIPWLHRKHIGASKAYWKTVFFICFQPKRFAREFSRSVRVSIDDGRKFRSITLWLATISFAPVILALPVVAVRTYATLPPTSTMIFSTTVTIMALAAFRLFVHTATDIPLFIWKNKSGSSLAVQDDYACAPLAFLPIAGVALGTWCFVLLETNFRLESRFIWACTAVSVLWVVWVWVVALQLMSASVGAGSRRTLLLATYLPVHWLIAFAVSVCLLLLAAGLLHDFAHSILNLGGTRSQ